MDNNNQIQTENNLITRKEAIKKAGKYAAFTAVGMMLILNPLESSAKKKSKQPAAPTPW